jgi:hypothetical protein
MNSIHPFCAILPLAFLVLATTSGADSSPAPYAVDAHTRHLWHFDETGPGPVQPAAGIAGSFNLTPENGATPGAASAPGFSTAGNTMAGPTAGFRGAVIPVSSVTGPDGAFTFEAILQTSNISDLQQIITMENDGGSNTDRPFQFRIDGGQLRFINVAAATGTQSIFAPIPTTGPDAFVPGEWFHAAVAYNGSHDTAGNIRLYWTRLVPTRGSANEILAATMTRDLAGIATTFGVGQEYRSPSDNLKGSIDEVRISTIARTADEFLFNTAGNDPADPKDFPLVSYIPITDGNTSTDENGYAGSAINSIAFAQNNLITLGNQQFISYYRRHASDPNHPANNTVLVARRTLGESLWEIFPTPFTSFNINDTHNVISMAIDGDGVIHMSWGMHGNPLLYARSTGSVLGGDPIVMTSLGTAGMTGQENGVTYPKFQTLPDGDVVFLFREGGSGSGDWFLNRYDTDTDTWAPLHANGGGVHQPFMLGRGDSPDNCFYPDRLTLGPDGMLHLAGVFRYNADSLAGQPGYQTNHRYVYLRSPDGGTSWQRSDGSAIAVPVVEAGWFKDLGPVHVPEIIKDLPEGHSIMNESGMTTDSAGRPIIANWWADNASTGDHTRQYHLFFHDGTGWHQRTISARGIDNPATKYAESQLNLSLMGRPVVLTDAEDRIIVIYNDNRFEGITAVFSLPLAQDPGRNHWTRMNLTRENIGNWETTYDEERWRRDGVLHMIYQKLPGMGMSYTAVNNSTPVSVITWDARAYFNSPIDWTIDTTRTPGQAIISARTHTGFHYDLRTSTNLDFSTPPAVTLPGDGTWRDLGTWPLNEARRFWQLERREVATDEL